jgi:hypothetical protein
MRLCGGKSSYSEADIADFMVSLLADDAYFGQAAIPTA